MKKYLSLLLSFAMLISICSVSALASNTPDYDAILALHVLLNGIRAVLVTMLTLIHLALI